MLCKVHIAYTTETSVCTCIDAIYSTVFVYSYKLYFIGLYLGQPSAFQDTTNPDWVPIVKVQLLV